MSLREAIQTTSTFLSASIATETGLPLIQRLHNTIPPSWTPPQTELTRHTQVILYTLDLLRHVHTASLNENSQLGIKDWRHVNALLEIIVVLGLYKVLPSGVGIPESRRVKSVLLSREGQNEIIPDNEKTLQIDSIVSSFMSMMEENGEIGETLRRKHLVDILSGILNLSYNPSYSKSARTFWISSYERFLDTCYPSVFT
jgi:hypothetical protein